MRAIWINAEKHEITQVNISGNLASLQRAVGGNIELVPGSLLGDDLFVDEDGFSKQYTSGFAIDGRPFVGNGIVIGHTKSGRSAPASVLLEHVIAAVSFFRVGRVA